VRRSRAGLARVGAGPLHVAPHRRHGRADGAEGLLGAAVERHGDPLPACRQPAGDAPAADGPAPAGPVPRARHGPLPAAEPARRGGGRVVAVDWSTSRRRGDARGVKTMSVAGAREQYTAHLSAAGLDAPWLTPGPLIRPKASAMQARLWRWRDIEPLVRR